MSFLDDVVLKPKKLGLIIIVLILVFLGFNSIRNARIDALARSAMDRKADPNIVKKLASYSGARSADLLFLIAGAAPTQENRLAAIQALVDRKAVPLVSRLGELLVPTETLPVRRTVAEALYKTGCSPECVKNVLYFQERMWRGDRPSEDVDAAPPVQMSEAEKELQTSLDEVLKKNKAGVGLVLAKVYGLASDFPHPFAVDTVLRLQLREACPLLMHTYLSVNDEVRASPEYANVGKAVQIMQCPSPVRPAGR